MRAGPFCTMFRSPYAPPQRQEICAQATEWPSGYDRPRELANLWPNLFFLIPPRGAKRLQKYIVRDFWWLENLCQTIFSFFQRPWSIKWIEINRFWRWSRFSEIIEDCWDFATPGIRVKTAPGEVLTFCIIFEGHLFRGKFKG